MLTRRIAGAVVGAVAVVGLTAVPAAAQVMSVDVTGQCADPAVGSVRVAVSADVENPAYLSPAAEARRITGTVILPAAAVDALVAKGATTVEGKVNLQLAISGTYTARADNTLALASTPITPGRELVVPVIGYTAPVYSSYLTGTNYVDVTGIGVGLLPRRADTSPAVRGGINTPCTIAEPKRWMTIRTDSIISENHPAPRNLRFGNITTDSITVSWDPTRGLMGPPLGYDILVDEVPTLRLIGAGTTTGTVTGLKPNTDYYIRVKAVDMGGERRSEVFPIRTKDFLAHHYFDIGGTIAIKDTALRLVGEQATALELATGTHTSNPAFAPTQVRLATYGTANVEFTPVSPATGTFRGGVFTVTTRQKVTVPRITIGNRTYLTPNCTTTVDLPLTSAPDFKTDGTPNPMTGTITIPPFRDCGQPTSILNRLVAGPGNTADITYTSYAG
ncbi:fibronectin type III domain-containing protein [Actinokineospora terrae]|uniref:Fibronectin type III domain-containing protein n=1 Tax=Actinokineospora terrae TaxID=155974 RepID=A0A1H9MU48_9PSEU|nr:fibronectin type III domain-containing protein [Actinokineospora terrae]SER26653.1 Fibronectin type III domain-containing protein [Actinokineospora terrae]